MGGLRLFAFEKVRGQKNGNEKLLWEKFGDQKERWHNEEHIYRPASNVEVSFIFCLYKVIDGPACFNLERLFFIAISVLSLSNLIKSFMILPVLRRSV